jgi:hypothetical protein
LTCSWRIPHCRHRHRGELKVFHIIIDFIGIVIVDRKTQLDETVDALANVAGSSRRNQT